MLRTSSLLLGLSAACITAVAHADDTTKFTLAGGEEPETKSWNDPASFAYVSNNGGKDTWAVNLAGKIEGQPIPTSTLILFARALVEKNTQADKEIENFGFSAGSKFDWNTARDGPTSPGPDLNALYVFGETSLGFTDKAIFADPKAVCTTPPLPAECGKQRETSLRAQLALRFHMVPWEETFGYSDSSHTAYIGPSWTRSIAPVVTLFHDEVLDAKLNASGVRPDGGVTGAKVVVSAATSPRFSEYRLILSAKLQHTEAFDRSALRKEGFQKSATFVKLAADYEFGPRAFDETAFGWVPAVGIAYTKGDDPLTGKTDFDNVTLAFKISYRPEAKKP